MLNRHFSFRRQTKRQYTPSTGTRTPAQHHSTPDINLAIGYLDIDFIREGSPTFPTT